MMKMAKHNLKLCGVHTLQDYYSLFDDHNDAE